MSYQVLARKWRPRSFADMVGQAHVVRALSNALDQDRLHHAYLFTGTRGVGKTTLARILAKALNCEAGVGSTPCCQCPSCREIDEGRFVDLLEVDAASRTRVDQTRDLLDNVPFAPVKGRFKVYLIDEVHMFSTSSFNALLKTLEEPPPHVKFLLATTDPQKVPVTVLSRCLQFNLKRLVPEEIATQLAHILTVEAVPFEAPALALLARAADGSMRDGLSLLDQAIAFGGGRVGAEDIRAMLGTVGRDMSLRLLQALAARDGAALLAEVARIHELAPDFGGVLQEVLALLHRLALFQQVPATLAVDDPEREALMALGRNLSPEDVQLYYQIALLGQADLPLAPDPRTGMEMVLLRMLAFRPGEVVQPPAPPRGAGSGVGAGSVPRVGAGSGLGAEAAGAGSALHGAASQAPRLPGVAERMVSSGPSASGAPGPVGPATAPAPTSGSYHPASAALAAAKLATAAAAKPGRSHQTQSQPQSQPQPQPAAPATKGARTGSDVPPHPPVFPSTPVTQGNVPVPEQAPMTLVSERSASIDAVHDRGQAPVALVSDRPEPIEAVSEGVRAPMATGGPPSLANREDWHALVARLELGGVASELAHNCELVAWDGQCLRLTLDQASQRLRVATTEQRLRAALAVVLGADLRLEIQVAHPEGETPSQRRTREAGERQRAAEEALAADPVTQALGNQFGARLIPGSVRPMT